MVKKGGWLYGQKNYSLILVSIILLLAGFLLLKGSSNNNPDMFNGDIYNFRRLSLAPLVLIAGYLLMVYALIAAPDNKKIDRND